MAGAVVREGKQGGGRREEEGGGGGRREEEGGANTLFGKHLLARCRSCVGGGGVGVWVLE